MSTVTWRSGQSGFWRLGSFWDLGVAPAAADTAVIAQPGAYVVMLDAPAAANTLVFDAAGASLVETNGGLTLSNNLVLEAGEITLDGANALNAVELDGGVLSIASDSALGSAGLLMFGGEVAAAASVTAGANLTLSGQDNISVAAGATLALTGHVVFEGQETISFGGNGATGAVIWQASSVTLAFNASASLDVRSGSLTFDSFELGLAAAQEAWTSIDVESGATLDLGGSPTTIDTLSGFGVLTSSGGVGEDVTVGGGAFGGTIAGDIGLILTGDLKLSGVSELSSLAIAANDSLTNSVGGVIDFDTDGSLAASSGQAYLENDGSFLRGGSAGDQSLVSVVFFNSGYMQNTGGAVRFTDGLINSGVVEGVLTTGSGGVVTWSADAPGAALTFVGAGDDDVFSLTAAPGHIDGGGGVNTVDALASMTFAAGSLVNIQRIVVASGATVNLSALSGDDTVVLASQPGASTAVTGTSGRDSFIANSGADSITFGSSTGDSAALAATNGAWDTVTGQDGSISLANAQANVVGGGDTVNFVSGAQDAVSLYATQGAWDIVNDFGGEVILNDAQAKVLGGAAFVYLNGNTGNDVSLFYTFGSPDGVYGSNAIVELTQAQANLTGGGDTVYFSAQSGESLALAGTAGNWDNVQGAGAVVTLDGAQASLTGGGDALTFGAGANNQASLYSTGGAWDTVSGDGAVVYLIGAQASLIGRGDSVSFNGGAGNSVSLYATAGAWDTVYNAGVVTLVNAQANLMAAGDTAYFNGTAGESVTAFGGSDVFVFGATLGIDWLSGFRASDVIQLAKTDFASFNALLADTAQTSAGATITLDGNDVLTLAGVSKSSLVAAEFKFV